MKEDVDEDYFDSSWEDVDGYYFWKEEEEEENGL